MLTYEMIIEQARAISPVIDRQNYGAVAAQIHPPVGSVRRLPDDVDDGAEYNLPEWQEYQRPRPITTDWADAIARIVLARQWSATLIERGLAVTAEQGRQG